MKKIILSCVAVVALAFISGCASDTTHSKTTTSQDTTYHSPTTTTTTDTQPNKVRLWSWCARASAVRIRTGYFKMLFGVNATRFRRRYCRDQGAGDKFVVTAIHRFRFKPARGRPGRAAAKPHHSFLTAKGQQVRSLPLLKCSSAGWFLSGSTRERRW